MLAYSFMLESFVFISGYIMGYQLIEKRKYDTRWSGVKNKFTRLVIPSLFFSCIYFLLFMEYQSIPDTAMTIVNGAGHLWYLPMLFWCFVFCLYLYHSKLDDKYKILIALALFGLQMIELPLRLNYTFQYFFFFYLGLLAFKCRDKIVKKVSIVNTVALWIIFAIVFISCTLLSNYLQCLTYGSLMIKALELELLNYMRLAYATLGSLAILFTAIFFVEKNALPALIIWTSPLCFGVYIYHQFILKFLYYQTSLPKSVSEAVLPWICFIVALPTSIMISKLTLTTRFGRKLIG